MTEPEVKRHRDGRLLQGLGLYALLNVCVYAAHALGIVADPSAIVMIFAYWAPAAGLLLAAWLQMVYEPPPFSRSGGCILVLTLVLLATANFWFLVRLSAEA